MNITAKPSSLLSAITATNHAGRIGIVGEGRQLFIYAGDGYRMFSIETADCTVDGNSRVWINAGPLESALKASGDADTCDIRADTSAVSYECGRVKMRCPVNVTAQDFDQVPDPDDSSKTVVVSGQIMAKAVELVRSIPKKVEGCDDWRSSVGFSVSDFGFDVAATDNKRIASVSITPTHPPTAPFSAAVHPRLLQGLGNMDGDVSVVEWGSWLGFFCNEISIVVRKLEREFPTIVQSGLAKMLGDAQPQVFDHASLLAATRTIGTMCEYYNYATLETKPGSCTLSSSTQSGDIAIPIVGEFTLNKLVRIQPWQLVSLIAHAPSKKITIGMGDEMAPVVMTVDADGATYTMAVCPCRK